VAAWLTSTLSNSMVNELRAGFSRLDTNTNSADPSSEEIPSLEINELGMIGFNAATNRTAIGLAVNLPQWRINDLWQVQDTFSYIRGDHTWKAGFDLRMVDVDSFFNPTLRGRLVYPTLQRFVDDVADVATINRCRAGRRSSTTWNDTYFFVGRVAGAADLHAQPRPALRASRQLDRQPAGPQRADRGGGGRRRMRASPVPKRDPNNIQPRVGFNWTPHTSGEGFLGFLTGGDKLVVRGGYARTHDYAFLNIALNIASAFPQVATVTYTPGSGAWVPARDSASGLNPLTSPAPSCPRTSLPQPTSSASSCARSGQHGLPRAHRDARARSLPDARRQPRQPYSTVRVDPARGIIREDNAPLL
jgi:hypothetical protein